MAIVDGSWTIQFCSFRLPKPSLRDRVCRYVDGETRKATHERRGCLEERIKEGQAPTIQDESLWLSQLSATIELAMTQHRIDSRANSLEILMKFALEPRNFYDFRGVDSVSQRIRSVYTRRAQIFQLEQTHRHHENYKTPTMNTPITLQTQPTRILQ